MKRCIGALDCGKWGNLDFFEHISRKALKRTKSMTQITMNEVVTNVLANYLVLKASNIATAKKLFKV